MRRTIMAALLAAGATPALADETAGTVAAYDRVDRVIVLNDKTIWELPDTLALPDDLAAGDRIRIDFTSAGDSGVGKINAITREDG